MSTLDEWLDPGGSRSRDGGGGHDQGRGHHQSREEEEEVVQAGSKSSSDGSSAVPPPDGAAPSGSTPMVDDDDLDPDLGLGTLSAEDIKWVDLEFLDLASAPPERSRPKNSALSDNFPDIFFGDAAFSSSSIFNNFNIDDFKPFGENFAKEGGLDLESVEKNILVSGSVEIKLAIVS